MKVAIVQEPIKITVENSQALITHTEILMLRSRRFNYIEQEISKSQKHLLQAEHAYKKAKLEHELAQLHGQQLFNQEKELVDLFFAQVRNSHTIMKSLQERYGDGIRFIFDSDDKQVWILGVFSSDAPPILQEEPDFLGDEYESDDGEEEIPGDS